MPLGVLSQGQAPQQWCRVECAEINPYVYVTLILNRGPKTS